MEGKGGNERLGVGLRRVGGAVESSWRGTADYTKLVHETHPQGLHRGSLALCGVFRSNPCPPHVTQHIPLAPFKDERGEII